MQFNGTPEEWDALVKKNRQVSVKLYTEEQVRKLLKKAFWQDFHEGDTEESLMNELTPIGIPSDEDIENKIESLRGWVLIEKDFFERGASWMRNQILNKIK